MKGEGKMKSKKSLTVVALALVFTLFLTANVFAAAAWYTCTISKVGGYTADDGAIQVRLTDTKGAFSNVYFTIAEGRLNQILAVFLTAASNGATVYVYADPVAKTLTRAYYNVE
jgi:hypothetical protein